MGKNAPRPGGGGLEGGETRRLLARPSPRGTDPNEEVVQAHCLEHGPRVVWQSHEPHLAIFGVSEALGGQKERKYLKVNNMRVCKVDQNIRLDVFWDVYGDLRYGLNGVRARWETPAPSIAVVSAHDHLLVQIEGAGDADAGPVSFTLKSRAKTGKIPSIGARG